MKKCRTILIVLCMTLLAGQLFAGGFALTGVDSRSTSMAGAFRGLADDPSAMYWNPAGLGFMNENSISLGGTFIMPTVKWDPSGTALVNNPGYSAQEYEANKKLTAFPSVFGTMAKSPRLKYGLAFYVPYGLGTTWDAYKLPGTPMVYVDGFPEDEMMSSIAVLDFHPTVAYRVMPNFSVGAGLSVMYGMIDIDQIKFPDNPYVPLTSELSGTGIGFGGNLGVLYKATERLSIGLAGKLPAEIPLEGDASVYLWTPAQADTLGNVTPAMKLGGKSDIEATLNIPAELGIGLAYKISPVWTLSLDYAYTMWENLETVKIEMDDPITIMPGMEVSESELVLNWENSSRISLGTEYKLGCNKIRAGFFFEQTPIPEATQIPTISDVGNKYSTNLGWGRQIGNFGVNANMQYIMFDEREITDSGQTADNVAGSYNSQSLSGNIGLSYKF
ncbi:MAG: outer membrane protein transport protein [Candidatus Cloacimonadaceae bacterium]|nr:outer membrane protein transport protein [Candidatus Cloacimonadota bacterium]MDY0127847.1 outer membrane protein transport protein [Candidatus Cloacimonadaceae bacterium]